MSNNRPIIKKIIYGISVCLQEPLCIANGVSEETDNDCLINKDGQPFVPGSSLAGAIRNYIEQADNKPGMMGYMQAFDLHMNNASSCMSALIVSDMMLYKDSNVDTTVKLDIRDQVKLDHKVAVDGSKFNMQIVPTGTMGIFYLELIIRDGDNEKEWGKQIDKVINGFNIGEIRLGTKKNRGYGAMCIVGTELKTFSKDNLQEWLDFDYSTFLEKVKLCKNNNTEIISNNRKYTTITIPLKLTGGISIRKYSTRPQEADYEHITCNDGPIIPGTSWTGAIRNRCVEFLYDLNVKDVDGVMNQWFGFVNDVTKEAKQSQVIVGESQIRDSKSLVITRNKIDRITNKTVNGSLYTEKSYFGGTTELSIKVLKDKQNNYPALIGLLIMVLKDIGNGLLSIGGQTAVGRGIFKENGPIIVNENESLSDDKIENEYNNALFNFVKEHREV